MRTDSIIFQKFQDFRKETVVFGRSETYVWKGMYFMAKPRIITKRQEKAIRLCHPDFGNKSPAEAAKLMNISIRSIQRLLARVEKVAPQLFVEEHPLPRGRVSKYHESMDEYVKEQF